MLRTQIPNLGVGFALRCFQRLSLPNIATRRFSWYQSRYTRGPFSQVLSSCFALQNRWLTLTTRGYARRRRTRKYRTISPITRSTDYIFTLVCFANTQINADLTQTYADNFLFCPRQSAFSLRLSAVSQSETVGCRRIMATDSYHLHRVHNIKLCATVPVVTGSTLYARISKRIRPNYNRINSIQIR